MQSLHMLAAKRMEQLEGMKQQDTESEVSCMWISEYGILQNNDLFGLWKAGS